MTTQPPKDLPAGWTAHLDQTGSGLYYFYNASTGESTWEVPRGEAAPAGATPPPSNGAAQDFSRAWESFEQREQEYSRMRGHDSMGELGQGLYDVDYKKIHLDKIQSINTQEVLGASYQRSQAEIDAWRAQHQISIAGRDPPPPVLTFEETRFPQWVLDSFRRQGFTAPTMIQAQGWSAAMTGRDIVGIAKTGSGKTLAFGIPAIIHLRAQPAPRRGDGPGALVLAPTRELAMQIEEEMRKVTGNEVQTVCCYGGAPKGDQARYLRNGVDIVIATPGRLIDFLESRTTNLQRTTYVVMDEADRMLDMGFEPQIRKILGQIRPDRQTLLWSATWPKEVERLARDFLRDWVQIMVGSTELQANPDVTQHIHVTHNMGQKFDMIFELLRSYGQRGVTKALIFVGTKRAADDVTMELSRGGFHGRAIHGDKSQVDRERSLREFRARPQCILVATDVAARGLDIRDLQLVINFDFPSTLEDYVHRIGRTGRAGAKGDAHTLFSLQDAKHARGLTHLMRKAGQQIPACLEEIMRQPPPPSSKGGKGRRGFGGGGGGMRGGFGGGDMGRMAGGGGGGYGGGFRDREPMRHRPY